jgi:PIN domain nuclease of toxin-antitoxin system
MKVLVDTHIFLWSLAAPENLSEHTLSLLENDSIEKLFSAASSWEIAINWSKGHIDLPESPLSLIPAKIGEAGFTPLPITIRDTLNVGELPMHHRDPFDRLLISQARSGGLSILTNDRIMAKYDVDVIALWSDAGDDE